jgi:menaquinone-dependent protoporphyrinogen oxidase
MKVLVAYGSRHGATVEVASAIASALRGTGTDVELRSVSDVGGVEQYDAVVVGSAVYMGRWVEEARSFLASNEAALLARPTWLFSTGPVGTPPVPSAEAPEVESMVQRVAARGHRTFPGKLDRSELGLLERAAVAIVKAPDGDYRDWPAVAAWAAEIGAALRGPPDASTGQKSTR